VKTTADRIKEAMEIRNMRQTDIIEKTGISKGALSSYISGKYVPKQTNTYKIAKALNVDPSWLMGLDVPMESKKTKGGMSNYEIAALINKLREKSDFQKLLSDFDALPVEKKKVVLELVQVLKGKERE
jgi:transcriptional regulator with XRE-family HTH domain